jgi:hypothetical protein
MWQKQLNSTAQEIGVKAFRSGLIPKRDVRSHDFYLVKFNLLKKE